MMTKSFKQILAVPDVMFCIYPHLNGTDCFHVYHSLIKMFPHRSRNLGSCERKKYHSAPEIYHTFNPGVNSLSKFHSRVDGISGALLFADEMNICFQNLFGISKFHNLTNSDQFKILFKVSL